MADITPEIWQTRMMEAFETFFRTLFTVDEVQIASPNRPFDRAKVDPSENVFLEWIMTGSPDGQTRYSNSVQNNFYKRDGTIVMTANVRVHQKVALGLDVLDAVGHFYEAAVIQGGWIHTLGTPLDLGSDGSWYQTSLSANWSYFTDRASTLT